MPVKGQPKMLGTLLDTLFANDELRTWSIYEEKSGNITVKIRFNGQHGGQAGLNIEPGSFKRKSDRQFKRDKSRAKDYELNKNQGVTTRSQSKDKTGQTGDIEHARFVSDISSTPLKFSPGMFQVSRQDSISVSNTPPACTGSTPQHSPTNDLLVNKDNSLLEANHVHTPLNSPVYENDPKYSPIIKSPDYDDSLSQNNSLDDESITDDHVMSGCHNDFCTYGGESKWDYLDIYKCHSKNKGCKDLYVCLKCKHEGGHSKHAKYLKLHHKGNFSDIT